MPADTAERVDGDLLGPDLLGELVEDAEGDLGGSLDVTVRHRVGGDLKVAGDQLPGGVHRVSSLPLVGCGLDLGQSPSDSVPGVCEKVVGLDDYDPASKRIRLYYPDFVARMDDDSWQLVEVKADFRIDDALVQAKAQAAEEMAVESGVKYIM